MGESQAFGHDGNAGRRPTGRSDRRPREGPRRWTALKKNCPEDVLRAFTEGPPSISTAHAGKTDESDADLIGRLKSLGYTQ